MGRDRPLRACSPHTPTRRPGAAPGWLRAGGDDAAACDVAASDARTCTGSIGRRASERIRNSGSGAHVERYRRRRRLPVARNPISDSNDRGRAGKNVGQQVVRKRSLARNGAKSALTACILQQRNISFGKMDRPRDVRRHCCGFGEVRKTSVVQLHSASIVSVRRKVLPTLYCGTNDFSLTVVAAIGAKIRNRKFVKCVCRPSL